MDWLEDGTVSLRANNGKLVATKKSGHLYANAESVDDSCKFYFYLINRCVCVMVFHRVQCGLCNCGIVVGSFWGF